MSAEPPEAAPRLIYMRGVARAGLIPAAVVVSVLAAACSGSGSGSVAVGGTVTGHLYGTGGLAPGSPRPWPGTVTLTGHGFRRDVPASKSGAYSVTIPVGRYTVTGHSPQYGGGAYLCHAAGVVIITSGHTTTADVWCQMMLWATPPCRS